MSTQSPPAQPPAAPARGNRALVVENDPTDPPGLLGVWLAEAGLDLDVRRPHTGAALPDDLDGYAALVVLGGEPCAYPGPDGAPGAPWFPALETLLRRAVRHRLPTLAVCLGAQLLAAATGGVVAPGSAGPELGAALVAKRDAAWDDPLFAEVPFAPDVLQWHHDEITELPRGAVLLAASTRYPVQAFRTGPAAWGVQFHIECDLEMVAGWAMQSVPELLELDLDGVELLERVERALPDVERVWRPVAERFAALALGGPTAPRLQLPLVDQRSER